MKFEDFIKNKKVCKSPPDKQKANSQVKKSAKNLLFIQTMPINKDSASIILTRSYECVTQIPTDIP